MLNALNYVTYINIDKFNSMFLRQGEGTHFTHELEWRLLIFN